MAVEGPGLKESCREVETWHPKESLGKATGEHAAQLQQKTSLFGGCQYHRMTTKNSRSQAVLRSCAGKVWITFGIPRG